MRHRPIIAGATAICLFLSAIASATDFSGTYRSPKIVLQLTASPDGYAGTMTIDGAACPVTAKEKAGALVGTFAAQGDKFDFDAQLADATLTLHSGGNAFELNLKQAYSLIA